MQRITVILAALLGIAICVLVYMSQQVKMERSLREREAQVTHRFDKMIRAIVDQLDLDKEIPEDSGIEETLHALAEAIQERLRRAERAQANAFADQLMNGLERGESDVGADAERPTAHVQANDSSSKSLEQTRHVAEQETSASAAADWARIVTTVSDTESDERSLVIIEPDLTEHVLLTATPRRYQHPVWSPGGDQVAFAWSTDEGDEIWVINADGQGLRQVTDDHYLKSFPSWSPDGAHLAYVQHEADGSAIYLINLADEEPQLLVPDAWMPHWSPDGDRIVFVQNQQVFVADSNGDNAEPLVQGVESQVWAGLFPRWSPNGKQIAFSAVASADAATDSGPAASLQLYVIDVASRQVVRLTNSATHKVTLGWTPDGQHILFTTEEGKLMLINITDKVIRSIPVRPTGWADMQVSALPVEK